jgi:hypothetical protein
VDGTFAHKLRVLLKSGGNVTVWIDPDTWMVIRDLQTLTVRGAEQQVETDYGDYEKAGGVYVPMSEESGPRNSHGRSAACVARPDIPAGALTAQRSGRAASGFAAARL